MNDKKTFRDTCIHASSKFKARLLHSLQTIEYSITKLKWLNY